MLNRGKEAAILQWLACHNIQVHAVSDLQDGLQLLNLISSLDSLVNSENVDPCHAFAFIEKILCDLYSFLPAHFLTHGHGAKGLGGCRSDADLAVAAVLVLSALVFRMDSFSPTRKLGPLLSTDSATQRHIQDFMEIVLARDNVLDTLLAYVKVGVEGESTPIGSRQSKRRKGTLFTPSPTMRPPLKQLSPSPQQLQQLPAHQLRELKMLREYLMDEEQAHAELRQEAEQLKEAVKHKDKQIKGMNKRIQCLQAESSERSLIIASLQDSVEKLQAQKKFLEDKNISLEKVREDYDNVIRQNIALQSKNEWLSDLSQLLIEKLAASSAQMSKLTSRLIVEEDCGAEFLAEFAEKIRDLEATLDRFSSMHGGRRQLSSFSSLVMSPFKSPQARPMSCYQELLMVELQETNSRLREDMAHLRQELVEMRLTLDAQEHAAAEGAAKVAQLRTEKEQLLLDLANQTSELRKATAKQRELRLKCGILSNKNQGLKDELKSINEGSKKRFQASMVSTSAMYEKRNDLKEAEAALKDEVATWNNNPTRRVAEEGILHSGEDVTALDGQLAAIKQQRDRLVIENRSLQAQVSFCEAKLCEQNKVAGKADRTSILPLCSTPSQGSYQRQPRSFRQSRSSLSSMDQFLEVPVANKCSPRRKSRAGTLAQATTLDSNICSESCFPCDEESDVISETNPAVRKFPEEDPMGRYSELYRRNRMVLSHLKSCYPVETQQCTIPSSLLKGDSWFACTPMLGQAKESSKRMQPMWYSSSDGGAYKPI